MTTNIILFPSYFPSISQYQHMVKANHITLEIEDNFQKQTNRNRMYIYSPNGTQMLNIPIKHPKENTHQKTKDVKIEYAFDWQKQHFKSLEAAYRSSPFFEFFEDELFPIFEKKHVFLLDLNIETFELINQLINFNPVYSNTSEYFKTVENLIDLRHLVNGKKDKTIIEPYTQVFQEKKGFINNLSILDLLFNEGRYTLEYLKK